MQSLKKKDNAELEKEQREHSDSWQEQTTIFIATSDDYQQKS